MPTANPCVQCKEKHVKCDEQRPKCRRCEKKKLDCNRPSKVTVFRHDAMSTFATDQKWVKSQARKFQFDAHTPANPSVLSNSPDSIAVSSPRFLPEQDVPPTIQKPMQRSLSASDVSRETASGKRRRTEGVLPDPRGDLGRPFIPTLSDYHGGVLPPIMAHEPEEMLLPEHVLPEPWSHSASHPVGVQQPFAAFEPTPVSPTSVVLNLPVPWQSRETPSLEASHSLPTPDNSVWPVPNDASTSSISFPDTSGLAPHDPEPQDDDVRTFPLQDIQEASLLRYYIEEIAHWLDLADERRHFEVVVPARARTQPHLLNAIFAVAARHLSRMPQYKTPSGIVYRNNLLPRLTVHSAVEYTLKCIPAMRTYIGVGEEYLESVVATAVLLRQLEEIDDEQHDREGSDGSAAEQQRERSEEEEERERREEREETPREGGVQSNFLQITDVVLRSEGARSLIERSDLIQAAYWMALRQEIFQSFTKRQAPKLVLSEDHWKGASKVNKAVMHTVQVMRWRWGDEQSHTMEEWQRLMRQQKYLEDHVLASYQPIYRKEAERKEGEIFPVVWYSSNLQMTSMQQALMARSVLTAEDPTLRIDAAARTGWRLAEQEVRELILELCGIAMGNRDSPPALLHTVFLIQMYGDFFTDKYERHALKTVVERYRDTRAWPSKNVLVMFDE